MYYFRKCMLNKAHQDINEAMMDIECMLKDCADVGIADSYWLLAWIRLFEVWEYDLESLTQLNDASKNILHYLDR